MKTGRIFALLLLECGFYLGLLIESISTVTVVSGDDIFVILLIKSRFCRS